MTEFWIGVNLGDVVADGERIYGDGLIEYLLTGFLAAPEMTDVSS